MLHKVVDGTKSYMDKRSIKNAEEAKDFVVTEYRKFTDVVSGLFETNFNEALTIYKFSAVSKEYQNHLKLLLFPYLFKSFLHILQPKYIYMKDVAYKKAVFY